MSTMSLPTLVHKFFIDRLNTQMEASPNTIASYRDTFRLLLLFASKVSGRKPTSLNISDINADMVGQFLSNIEDVRKNSARSRNTRLAAIRSFFKFVAVNEPAYLLYCQQILSMPNKRYVRGNVEFLDAKEMQALLNTPDFSSWIGRRDHTILTLALQTGLRVSELINLRCSDVCLETGAHVRCEGKGRKRRATPLSRETVIVLKNWLIERNGSTNDPLFPTIRGGKMSRDALEHLVKRHVKRAAVSCPSLIGKRVSPHVLRHSTAMDLLHHGIDQTVIAL